MYGLLKMNDFYLIFNLFTNILVLYIYIYLFWVLIKEKIIKDKHIIFYSYLFKYKNEFIYNISDNLFQKEIQQYTRYIDWVDIWEFNTKISSLEDQHDLPWNMYYKYKLSMFNTWHVLEDRIAIFFVFIILCL
jgi:hypothetical protein